MRAVLCIVAATAIVWGAACSRGADAPAAVKPAVPSGPPAWNVTVKPLDAPAGAHSAEPQITSSSRGVILSWLEQDGKTATLKFAERANGAWSAPAAVASGTDWFVSWADVPSVMRMRNGTLVANWYRNTNIEDEAYDLWMAHSTDDGRTWSTPMMPHHDRTKTQHGFATLFETADNHLGLVWIDGRENETNKAHPENAAMMLRYAAFDPQWKETTDEVVNLRVCDCCQTSVAMTADGPIAAFRDRSDEEIRDIHVTRLQADGRWSDADPVHDDKWMIDSCPVNGPAIAARGRDVVAAWFTAAGNQGHTFAAFSADGGRTWGAPVRLDDGRSLGHVDVEMLDDGSAVASWVEFAGGTAHFRVRHLDAKGGRSAAVDIAGGGSTRVSGYPRMARSGDELVLAWTESTGGSEDEPSAQTVKAAVVKMK